jgi:hypothetical protein
MSETNAQEPPIFCLTNAAFSGSTIFSLLIDSHPGVVALGDGLNPGVLRHQHEEYYCACGSRIGDCGFWTSVFDSVRDQGLRFSVTDCNMRYSFLEPALDRAVGRYYLDPLRSTLRDFAYRYVPPYKRHVRLHDARNDAFIRAVTEVSGKKVFIHNAKPLLVLHYLTQRAPSRIRVINMVRDPRGFVHSMTKRGATLARATTAWARYQKMVQTLLERLEDSQAITLRYEDLCLDAESSLAPVFEFLGVGNYPISQTIIPRQHHVLGNALRLKEKLVLRLDESWKTSLSATQLREVARKCGSRAEALGYRL